MKFTINGISQSRAIEMKLDYTDILILAYIRDFRESGKMIKRIEEGEIYYWIKYEGILEEYPILKIKKDTLYRKMKNLVELEVLTHLTIREGGTFSYYGLAPRFFALLSDSYDINGNEKEDKGYGKKSGRVGKKSVGGTEKNPEGYGKKSGTNNPSTIYPSTKDNKESILTPTFLDLSFIDDSIDQVKITEEQYKKLISKYTKDIVHTNILNLDNYMANKKKYKDHYKALNNWCSKEYKLLAPEEQKKTGQAQVKIDIEKQREMYKERLSKKIG